MSMINFRKIAKPETKPKPKPFMISDYLISRLFWILTGLALGYLWAYKALS